MNGRAAQREEVSWITGKCRRDSSAGTRGVDTTNGVITGSTPQHPGPYGAKEFTKTKPPFVYLSY